MTTDRRPDPDALLTSLKREEAKRARGQLKVFLGMCPGVGKTFAMLEAAHREQKAGRDVVIGLVETHGRAETEELAAGLPEIPRLRIEYRGVTLTELDLDAVLTRRPQLVLVDELAHTNAPGSRHPKRWQDVEELLEASIDVLTTLNVQHVASRADTVRQITGAEIRETVPDRILDEAEMELIDLPPAELLQRLREGRVYVPDRATVAAENFFREANLTALRELALRLVADHVGVGTRELRLTRAQPGAWKTADRLLVAVGSGSRSIPLIRWTRRMADALQCSWLAVHVERAALLSEPAQAQLAQNLATARELGAEVIVSADADVVDGLLRVAREQNVTQIVYGKPASAGWLEWMGSMRSLWRLARESGDIDVHVVRAEKQRAPEHRKRWGPAFHSSARQYLAALGTIAATTLVNAGLMPLTGPRVPGLVFLLVVVISALFVGRGPVMVAGAVSALVWNFFFLPPRFTFVMHRPHDTVLFVAYFVVALVLGQLVARVRVQQRVERQREVRATSLYELMRDLAGAGSREEIIWQVMAQVHRVFQAPAAIVLPVGERLASHPDSMVALTDKELAVADWAFRQRKAAGRFTDNLPGAGALHLPLVTDRKAFGVLTVGVEKELPLAQRELLGIFAQQAALALDRTELRVATEQARLLAESERLSRALLNSISHELRTPLAAITSAASSLSESVSPALQRTLIGEIHEANARLNRVVGNLLDLARLEHGNVRAHLDWHDVHDLVRTTLGDLERELSASRVKLEMPAAPLLAWLDYSLVQHALANLLLNAAMHTPPGTTIEVRARLSDQVLVMSVLDEGPGIPADVMPRVFDRFIRASDAPAGGSGLGLAIAKGFIESQGGSITAGNRESGGAEFTLRLPQPDSAPKIEQSA